MRGMTGQHRLEWSAVSGALTAAVVPGLSAHPQPCRPASRRTVGPLFLMAAHAESAFVRVERDLIAVERPSFVEVEAPCPARRMAAIIAFLGTAPLIAG